VIEQAVRAVKTNRTMRRYSSMEIPDRAALEQFAREHHVHYDVEPETARQRDRTEVVGFGVRLLATHEGSKLAAPACPKCMELLSGLRSFAERLIRSGEAASWTELVPDPAVLHESSEVRGADEVALTLRVRSDPGGHSPEHASADHRLSEIRERLEAVGVSHH
jgi:hypothetical protein